MDAIVAEDSSAFIFKILRMYDTFIPNNFFFQLDQYFLIRRKVEKKLKILKTLKPFILRYNNAKNN